MAWKQHPTAKTLSPECKLTVEDVEDLIRARNKARRSRNFTLADKLLFGEKNSGTNSQACHILFFFFGHEPPRNRPHADHDAPTKKRKNYVFCR